MAFSPLQVSPSAPTGTTSTTLVMMGLGAQGTPTIITPVSTGRVLIVIAGDVTQNTTADGAKYQISFGTGSAPANAAALTGTQIGPVPTMTFLTGVLTVPFSIQAVATGLAINTAAWIDIALAAITGGTASLSNLSVTAYEI